MTPQLIQQSKHLLTTVMISAWAAMAVATSAVLIFLPNIETITLIIFLMGVLFPLPYAALGVITTTFLFEMVATLAYGPSGILLYFKLLSWFLIMLIGKISLPYFHFLLQRSRLTLFDRIMISGLGAFCAVVYDVITTGGILLLLPSSSFSSQSILLVYLSLLITGLPFTALHVLSNALLFSFLPDLLSSYLHKIRLLNIHLSFSHPFVFTMSPSSFSSSSPSSSPSLSKKAR